MIGTQARVVFVGVVAALAVGIAVGSMPHSVSTLTWVALAFGTTLSAALFLVEHVLGHGIWHYTAPYPYEPARPIAEAGKPCGQLPRPADCAVGNSPQRRPRPATAIGLR